LKEAVEMNFEEIEVISDSELMVKQINGEYQVKNQGLKPLYSEACRLLKEFKNYYVRHVGREQNKEPMLWLIRELTMLLMKNGFVEIARCDNLTLRAYML